MKRLLPIILFACSLSACHKDDIVWNPSVYVGGYIGNASPSGLIGSDTGPLLWKDGQQIVLSGVIGGEVNNIVVYNNDVYASSSQGYWKNGHFVNITTYSNGISNDYIAVSDSGVYVAGSAQIMMSLYATLWKNNGQQIMLTPPDSILDSGIITNIVASGNDIYILGEAFNNTNLKAPLSGAMGYWKNKQWSVVDSAGLSSDIAVDGKDVYVSGHYFTGFSAGDTTALYWKNGKGVTLSENAMAKGIAISNNNDVYVAGFISPNSQTNKTKFKVAGYWKNGQWVALSDGTSNAVANDIALFGNDVYTAGHITNGNNTIAGYWKNGHWNAIANGEATSIVVQ